MYNNEFVLCRYCTGLEENPLPAVPIPHDGAS